MSDEDRQRVSPGFDALNRTLLTDDANLAEALRRVAGAGCGLLTNCASASVTIIERGRAITVGSTSDVAEALDDAQYSAGDGPCLTAARDGVLVRIDQADTEQRWPNFCRRAVERGVHSSLSIPLALSGDDAWGGFNVYGSVAAGFTDDDEQLCQAFAAQASIVVSNAQAYWASLELSRNLSKAMESRGVIEQAKGILMSTRRVSADDAFDLLVARSQKENRKLRQVAEDILREALGDDDD
jgi:GAF domain-containing protein